MTALATPRPTAPLDKTGTNEPVEQARYRTAEGLERIVYAQRVEGHVCLTDAPALTPGRCYLIEDHLHSRDELNAIVDDYLRQAELHERIPVLHVPGLTP